MMTTEIKAALFALFLAAALAACIAVVLTETWPWVIGTELESDGQVEYLCLGTGCEEIKG